MNSRLFSLRRPANRLRVIAVVGAVAMGLAACGGGSTKSGSTPSPSATTSPSVTAEATTPSLTGSITVLAAASLTGTFTELGKQFEAANPGTKVTFSFGASSTLATQINEGAPADVFAAANTSTMKQVTDAGNAAGTPTIFVKNRLEIAVPKGNPAHVTGLADFAGPKFKTALCAPQVPCGSAAVKVFELAGITPKPVTYATDVKAALTQVSLGEVDAALVYRTDVQAAGDKVEGIDFPESTKVINDYPIVVLEASTHADVAAAFVAFVLSPAGQAVLTAAGFEGP